MSWFTSRKTIESGLTRLGFIAEILMIWTVFDGSPFSMP
jgi:hypothetical protein